MRTKSKMIIGGAGLLLLLAVLVYFFAWYQIRKSFPVVSGSVSVPGLLHTVEVARDEYGVPHISAQSERDQLVALGYVHAQDRLWQMDLERKAGEGRLSELFGSETLPFDQMFRIVGIRRAAEAIERQLPDESRQRLQWYADGVNAYIVAHSDRVPIEFDLLRYAPEPWQPLHTLLLTRMMGWELNLSWWTDVTVGAIAERVGLQMAIEIMPSYPVDVPPTVPAEEWRKHLVEATGYMRTAYQYCASVGVTQPFGGSNAWAVTASRSATGGALMANDTHLQLTLPSRWYEVSLRTPEGCVRGMSIPGIPGVAAGRNDSLAWGVTSLMADEADFYVERLDSSAGERYLFDGIWYPVERSTETIHVRGDTAVPVVIRRTRHGPIVSDIRTPLQKGSYPYVVSMRWTGYEVDDPVSAFRAINRARDWKEFSEGVKQFSLPGMNFVYCDVHGNIGYRSGVRLPIRGQQSSLLPLPGWERSAEWKGFVPFAHLPAVFNPPEGYVATANNKVVDDSYPYHISDLWEPPSRIIRLRQILGQKNHRFSVEDFTSLQTDAYSHNAKEIVPVILSACRDTASGIPERERLVEYFENWNYVFAKEDIPTAIYQQFFVKLLESIFRDEMGEELFHDFVVLVNIPIRVTSRLLQEGTSPWFDDVRTETLETRDAIVRRTLREAVEALRKRLGSDPKQWRWGSLHTVTLRHPFGLRKPFDKIFNSGPYAFDGGSTALISGEYSFNDPFGVTVGPSFRQIFDMSHPGEARAVLPSGQSGQVFHPHYDDQTPLWLEGAYRISRSDEAVGVWERLVLEPVQ